MSIIGSNILAGASGQAGYNLNNSLRFRLIVRNNYNNYFSSGSVDSVVIKMKTKNSNESFNKLMQLG